jgi:hypothetical protein
MKVTWCLAVVISIVGCHESMNPPQAVAEPRATDAPTDVAALAEPARSTEMLHRAEAAAEAGRWREAADLFSTAWEYEAPVDAFLTSLETSRSEAMDEAAGDDEVNQLIYMVSMRERVRALAACPEPFPADLPGEYMVHYVLHMGEEVDPIEELSAADPWRVGLQLWSVRRGDSALEPEKAVELAVARYLERPDLWTDAVTGQLWLLAAEAGLVEATDAWPEMIRPKWREAPNDRGLVVVEVRQWGGGMIRTLPGMVGLLIDGEPVSPGWTGRPVPRELTPGPHTVRFLERFLHAREIPLEVEAGRCQALMMVAIAGV